MALYRKYRPKKLAEVVGQEQVVKALGAALKEKTTGHAYLFAGPRGTGKTSVARILAADLKCSQNDLYEIDAASNRGIDEIRALREGVGTLPFNSPVKVYIIDEVHMLTREAFNALLKTIEEPPSHAIFILATTELSKVPETIISRCQTFVFKKPTVAELLKVVKKVAQSEKLKLADEAAELVALSADGSFRDALGLLQQVMSLSGEKILTREGVEMITGAPSSKAVTNFVASILENNLERGLEAIRETIERERKLKVFLELGLRELRAILLLKLAPNLEKKIMGEWSSSELVELKKWSDSPAVKIIPAALRELLAAYDQVDHAYPPELPLELALYKIIGDKNES